MPRLLTFFFLLSSLGCSTPQPSLILGQWKVIYVDHGGTILQGRSFKGTQYTFRENETVFAESHKGDTLTSRYRLQGDSLTYVAIMTQVEETYHVDTLSALKLVISAEIDGIPTLIRMVKLKK
jgi:hypothetical protein